MFGPWVEQVRKSLDPRYHVDILVSPLRYVNRRERSHG
jgi:hypothetical protein